LEDKRFNFGAEIDSAKKNLAITYVNAFVNAGFGKDLLITNENNEDWIFRTKEDG
jgi:26S proteasome regulatory subunit N1